MAKIICTLLIYFNTIFIAYNVYENLPSSSSSSLSIALLRLAFFLSISSNSSSFKKTIYRASINVFIKDKI